MSGILLATEEREIAPEVIDAAARLAEPEQAPVYVFAIARVHGTSLGFPHPGLLPTKAEWEAAAPERRRGRRRRCAGAACAAPAACSAPAGPPSASARRHSGSSARRS